MPSDDESKDTTCKQLVAYRGAKSKCWLIYDIKLEDDIDLKEDDHSNMPKSLVDHAWSNRLLGLVQLKIILMDHFHGLSTMGGAYYALGANNDDFTTKAKELSLGQQLKLARLLGDGRLEVICYLNAILACSRLTGSKTCIDYVDKVIVPFIRRMPYRDPIIMNVLKHVRFTIIFRDILRSKEQICSQKTRSAR